MTRLCLCQLLLPALLLLLGVRPAAAHEPLVVESQLVLASDGTVVVTLLTRQSALLAATGSAHLEFQTQEELQQTLPAIGDYVLAHTELRADGQRVKLTFAGTSASIADNPLRLKLHGQVPATATRLAWRMSCFTDDANFSSVIAQATLRWHDQLSLPQTTPAGTTITWLATDFAAAAAPASTAPEPTPALPLSLAPITVSGTAPPAPPAPAPAPVTAGTFGQFLQLGFLHILPQGLDHILFVLGLFLLAPKLKPLLTQITAFTLAHSLTLGLSMAGLVMLPSRIVEPLIALSIAVVASENVFTRQVHPWRWLVVFGFGLVHGLGFASALHELHLQPDTILIPLVGFNLGVEGGQLAVVALAALLTCWAWQRPWYNRYLTIPASALIALVGLFWAVQRALGYGLAG